MKNIANKTKKETDIKKYKSQRNLVVKMNRKLKPDYYNSVDPKKINTDTKFWKMVKPMFSNVNPMEQKIILIEGDTYIHTYINYLVMQVYLKATNVDVDLQLQTKISLITFFKIESKTRD